MRTRFSGAASVPNVGAEEAICLQHTPAERAAVVGLRAAAAGRGACTGPRRPAAGSAAGVFLLSLSRHGVLIRSHDN